MFTFINNNREKVMELSKVIKTKKRPDLKESEYDLVYKYGILKLFVQFIYAK